MHDTLTIDFINELSSLKQESNKMLNFRKKALNKFLELDNPEFGPEINIDFNNITYYKKDNNDLKNNWSDVDINIREEMDTLGVIEIENNYLDGIGVQYDSKPIYHNMINYLDSVGVIFCDTDTALKKHPELFWKYFNNLVKYDENKYTALNTACWSGGSFIYIPKNTTLTRPLQSYFRINDSKIGQFERTIIIVDDNSSLNYIEGCTALTYSQTSLHAAVVEIYVGKNSSCRYSTIQNWSNDVYNLVTKRAIVEEGGIMEWVDGNIGSAVTMKYPTTILAGEHATGKTVSIASSSNGQNIDAGGKIIHLAPNTNSSVISKSLVSKNSTSTYRGKVKIIKKANNCTSNVKCDTLILDNNVTSNTIVDNIILNNTSTINHEAKTSKIDEEKLFYLTSRGLTKKDAKEIIILGFIEDFTKQLPLEYSVELTRLLKDNLGENS